MEKYTFKQFEKALDTYANEVAKAVEAAAKNELKVIGIPKKLWKVEIKKKINRYYAGLVEIKFAIKGVLENGKLPSVEELNKAKEDAGFIVPNQIKKKKVGEK